MAKRKTLSLTFEEQQLIIQALSRLVVILDADDSQRVTCSDLEDKVRNLITIDEGIE